MQVSFGSCSAGCWSVGGAHGYGGFDGNIFSKIGSAAKKVVKVVSKAAKPVVSYVVKPAIASSAAVLTGGLSTLVGQQAGGSTRELLGVKPTVIGMAEGALVGGAVLAAPAAAAALAPGTLTAGSIATGVGAAATLATTGVGVAKATGLLPGAKPPPIPGDAQPALMDPSTPLPTSLMAGMGPAGKSIAILALLAGIATIGYFAMPPKRKGRR